MLKELRELNYQQVQKEDDQRRGSILLKEKGKDVKMKQKQCDLDYRWQETQHYR